MDLDLLDVMVSSKEVTLLEAPPGICIDINYNVIFKTEYSDQDADGNYRPICYNSAGERYCGRYEKPVRRICIE